MLARFGPALFLLALAADVSGIGAPAIAAAPAAPPAVAAAAAAPDAPALRALLDQFLAGASNNDVATHDRFWAEDLIYTGSSGRRVGKADILRDLRSAPPPKPEDPKTLYRAEEVRIQQYDRAALVAFRLVATTTTRESTSVAHYLNTGFFLKRAGRWQAVGWQATRQPETAAK